jgi:DMSO/TMAO reductase YedYZ molybdopterin-dependent catalytic subunit
MNLTLHELKTRQRKELLFTLECSGNSGRPWMVSAVGNAKWTGTPLSPILNEAGVLDKGIEVVFIGSDEGEEEVRGIKMKQNFARSMSLADAMNPNNVLCYEMNGESLPQMNGFPVRLIAPGWYGIANNEHVGSVHEWVQRCTGREYAAGDEQFRARVRRRVGGFRRARLSQGSCRHPIAGLQSRGTNSARTIRCR